MKIGLDIGSTLSYKQRLVELRRCQESYESALRTVQAINDSDTNSFIPEKQADYDKRLAAILTRVTANQKAIADKIANPSKIVHLESSVSAISSYNKLVDEINGKIKEYNQKLVNVTDSLNKIKESFWLIMRWQYDQSISSYKQDLHRLQGEKSGLQSEIQQLKDRIQAETKTIEGERKRTVNLDEAVSHINQGLLELGIDGFRIEKYTDDRYKIVRLGEDTANAFRTLSEGEKMILSFLYFRELIKGRRAANSLPTKKIAVIDDPISSLSHIYVFNVGQMIKNDFFNSEDCEQVLVLTHSLYFFYELTDINHDRRKRTQKLIRLTKNKDGSKFNDMGYEEIQNDYQSYWAIIKDPSQPPALIANCMRNIVEYFFNFIEKRELNIVFQKEELRQSRFQAFNRFINRESHSLGQNIFDFKEFNYDDFTEGLRLVFVKNGYAEHYARMMK